MTAGPYTPPDPVLVLEVVSDSIDANGNHELVLRAIEGPDQCEFGLLGE